MMTAARHELGEGPKGLESWIGGQVGEQGSGR